MTPQQRDRIWQSLDRMAHLADNDPVRDRMPDITRRVRASQRRKVAGVVLAAVVLALGGVGVLRALPQPSTSPTTIDPAATSPAPSPDLSDTGGFTTFDERTVDLDGDSIEEGVALLVPTDLGGQNQLLRVTWGSGQVTTAKLPNIMEANLLDPVDLDGDGSLELIVGAGGGELAQYLVFQASPESLQQVRTVNSAGEELLLLSDADPSAWQTHVGRSGIYSYRLVDPTTTRFPAPVQAREWTLTGHTLTQSATSIERCVTFQPKFTFGPC